MSGAELRQAMIDAGIALFPLAWRRFFARSVAPRYPSIDTGRVWPQRRPADGEITPGLPELRLRNLVRALGEPWPPAWIMVEGRRHGVERVLNEPGAGSIPYRTADGKWVFLLPLAP
jgi:methionyl-tRNA formyltransferase